MRSNYRVEGKKEWKEHGLFRVGISKGGRVM